MNTFFSLIVPVYNVEKFLPRCLDSILLQDYQHFELICVNDGSTDGSSVILNDYAAKHKNIVLITQDNKGLGEARNVGLQVAKGDYVWFIDSDDWIKTDALKLLNEAIQKKCYSLILIDLIRTDGNKELNNLYGLPYSLRKVGQMCLSDDLAKELLCFNGHFFAQAKIFRRDIIQSFRFEKGFYEDLGLILQVAKMHDYVFNLNMGLYYYYVRANSITNTYDNRVFDSYYQYDIINKNLTDERYKPYLVHFFYYLSIMTYNRVKKSRSSILKKMLFREFGKRYKRVGRLSSIWRLQEITLRRKLKILIYYFLLKYEILI